MKSLRRNSATVGAGHRAAKADKAGLPERFGTWAEQSRKVLVNIAATLTAVLFIFLGWQQIRSGVGADLIEILPFEMAEDLSRQGTTGAALAVEVATSLHMLSRPESEARWATRSEMETGARPQADGAVLDSNDRDVKSSAGQQEAAYALVAASNSIDIQIPGTGFRFKDLIRALQAGFAKRRFEVSGNVVETPAGLKAMIEVNRVDGSSRGWVSLETASSADELATRIAKVVAYEVNPQSLIRHELTAERHRCADKPPCDFSSGIGLIQRLVRGGDKRAVPFAYLAWCYALGYEKKVVESVDKCRFAAQISPDDDLAYRNWGIALNHAGTFAEAEEKFRTSLRLQPRNPEALFGLGDAQWMLERPEESLRSFDAGARLSPVADWPLVSWGSRLLDRKQLREGRQKLQMAVERNPMDVEAWRLLAVAHSESNDLASELDAWRAVIELTPNAAAGYVRAGLALNELNRHEEAIPMFERVEHLAGDPTAHLLGRLGLGYALLESKRYEEAIAAYRKSRDIQPVADSFENVGTALSNLGRDAEALAEYQHAVELDPDRDTALANWADSLLTLHRYPEALEKSSLAIEVARKRGEKQEIGYINRAHAELALNQLDAAIADYRTATEIDPKFEDAFEGWATALDKQGKASEAADVRKRGHIDQAAAKRT